MKTFATSLFIIVCTLIAGMILRVKMASGLGRRR
jgi:hypothetical protein